MNKLSIYILLSCATTISMGQGLLTNNGTIAVEDEVPFAIQGNTANNGVFINEGALRLHGDWVNSGDYRSVSGTFSMLGDDQVFDPGESDYATLEISSTGFEIISDLTITQSLELLDGIITVPDNVKLIVKNGALIKGGSESTYINGPLFTSNNGDFTFPVGTEFNFLPITVKGISTEEPVGVQVFDRSLDAELSAELTNYSSNRYWRIFDNSTFSASGITLQVTDESFINTQSEAVIAFTNNQISALRILGIPTFIGSLNSGSISSSGKIFSGYYLLAEKSVSGPPVTVVNVVTSLQDGKHDFLRIENIEFYENNLVEVYDRQGIKVFHMEGYNNQDRVFRGSANVGSLGVLQSGNYYYTIQLGNGNREAGFIYLKN